MLSAIAVGAAAGSAPVVELLAEDGSVMRELDAFDRRFRGGVNVAMGDVTGDGTPDIIAATAHNAGLVNVFDGATYRLVGSFQPYGPRYRGGVNVAFGQLSTDGGGEILTGTAAGRAVVKVFDGATLAELQRIKPYGPGVWGVQVAAGNLDGDYTSEIITAPALGGPPVVKSFDPATGQLTAEFLADAPWYRGGLQIATGDFDNNRVPDLATVPRAGRGPRCGSGRAAARASSRSAGSTRRSTVAWSAGPSWGPWRRPGSSRIGSP